MSKGKHEAGGSSGWQRGGDPFQEERAPKAKPKVKKEKNRYGWNGMNTGQKVGVVAGCCLAALVIAVAGWWLIFVRAPVVDDNVLPSVVNNNPNRLPSEDGQGEGDQADGSSGEVSGRKDQVYTFLLLGKDTAGGGNTDTIILVSYDVPNGTVDCLSIPRDTMINVTWSIKRINAVFASSRGIEGLKEEVGHLTGIVPDFYVTVEWKAIGEIVEALGGVEFDVPYNMNYDDPTPGQDLHIHQKKGLRKLSGSDAMQVIRWRKNNKSDGGFEVGDTGRQKIQQDFLKAVAKQCLQLGNWTKVSQFAQIFFDNVTTDIKLENLLWFAQKAMGVDMDNVSFYSLPGDSNGSYNHQSYVFADPAGVVELVNEHLNPYSRDITEADLQIMYKTKNGGLAVTNGTLASSSMANPTSKPKSDAPKDPVPTVEPTGDPTDEPTLPDSGTTVDPGNTMTDPSTATTPGTTVDPGTTSTPGTSTDPSDPGDDTDPGTSTDPGAAAEDPGITPDPGTTSEPEPTPEPEPELPPEPESDPVLPEE